MQKRPFEDRLVDAARAVSKRTDYGVRTEPYRKRGHFKLVWSNAQAEWYATHRDFLNCKDGQARLDSNQILVESTLQKDAQAIAERLPPPGVYGYSTEAGRRSMRGCDCQKGRY